MRPFWSDAEQLKICVPGGCSMTRLMLVRVKTGLTPVQLAPGHPASAAVTVVGVVSTAGFVFRVRFPFLMASESMNVGAVGRSDQHLVLPRSHVAAVVLTLVDGGPGHRDRGEQVVVAQTGQDGATRRRRGHGADGGGGTDGFPVPLEVRTGSVRCRR